MMEHSRALTTAEIDAALTLLARLGITPERLVTARSVSPMPTFDQYIDRVSEAVTAGTRRAYATYWARVREVWGDRRLDEVTALEIKQLSESIRRRAVNRRNSRGGRSAAEHLISALRCVYRHAVDDSLLAASDNPAAHVAKPRRLSSTRRALQDSQLVSINEVAGRTGNDPELDTLILQLHTETACRRGGALALRPCDLDPEQCLIRLWEKGGTVRGNRYRPA